MNTVFARFAPIAVQQMHLLALVVHACGGPVDRGR
jgi:hypothetical protein